MILHTINKSPFEKNSLDTCLRLAKEGSTILFIEDGVYAALKGTTVEEKNAAATTRYRICVLDPDLEARGLGESVLVAGIKLVDYGGFVDLVAEHDTVQTWF